MKALRRKLGDVTNDEDITSTRSKRPRIRSRSPSPGSANEDMEQGEPANRLSNDTFVYQAGHKFFLICGPWVHLGEAIFDSEFNEAYSAAERFENENSKAQGQLQEIWGLLQGKFEREVLQQKWVCKMVCYFFFAKNCLLKYIMIQFMKGLKAERYNTASRIRNHCAAILGVREVDLMNAELRKTKFRDRIGWIKDDNGSGSYSAVDVEILHKNYGGEYSLSSIFLNPILMGVSVLCIQSFKYSSPI